MIIFLTGDVHHLSMNTRDQRLSDVSETQAAIQYLEIAERHGINATLFITGRTFTEEPTGISEMMRFKNLEVGGHTFSGLKPAPLHYLFLASSLSFYGPSFYQRWDIERTLQAIYSATGVYAKSWRTHAYASDRSTYDILNDSKVEVISDEINSRALFPYSIRPTLISLPINVIPDHEYIIHDMKQLEGAVRIAWSSWRPAFFSGKRLSREAFLTEQVTIKQWLELVKSQCKSIEKRNGFATILAHPICMKAIDDFTSFEELCSFLSSYDSKFVREVTDCLRS